MWKNIFDKVKAAENTGSQQTSGPVEYIIAGLGNPGSKYEGSRHNAGFMALDAVAEKAGASVDRLKFKGLTGRAVVGGKSALLLKPSTFMNLSGESLREAMNFYHIPPERTILLFDDISLLPGKIRIRAKGSAGGHNGVKNIIYLSGKDTFPRVKLGVGHKPPEWDLADWVLGKFSEEDLKHMKEAAQDAAAAVDLMVNGKIQEAMNLFNGKG